MVIEGDTYIALGGQVVDPNGSSSLPAANGGIIATSTALSETPQFYGSYGNYSRDGGDVGIEEPGVDPVTDTGAAALIGSDTAYSEAGAAFLSNFPDSLDNTNDNADTFMFFVPSNAAMAAIPLAGADLTVENVQRHIQTTVTALVDGGTVPLLVLRAVVTL